MKTFYRRCQILILLSVFFLIPFGTTGYAAKKFSVLMTCGDLSGPAGKAVSGFVEKLKIMSNGRLDIKPVPVGTIVGWGDLFDGVKMGTANMAWVPPNVIPQKNPISMVEAGIPGTLKDFQENQVLFYEKGLADMVRKEYAKNNIHWIGVWPSRAESFVSKVPIYTIDDLQGVKFRSGGNIGKVITKFGGSAMQKPVSEIYTMLSTGVIDAATFDSPSANYGRGFHEVTKYWQAPPSLNNLYNMSLQANMDFWKSLPVDLQTMIEEESKVYAEYYWRLKNQEDKVALEKVQKDHGITVITWSAEDLKKWGDAVRKLINDNYRLDDASAKAMDIVWAYMEELGR